jgi:hypothetical protein
MMFAINSQLTKEFFKVQFQIFLLKEKRLLRGCAYVGVQMNIINRA